MLEYDLVIIGGGLVGTSQVIALQQQGWRIALLEKNLPDSLLNTKTDNRPISLSYTSQVILETLGIWRELKKTASPIKEVHVSHRGNFGSLRIHAHEHQLAALGYVLPFAELQRTLYQRAASESKVEIIPSSKILSIQNQDPNKVSVQFLGNNKEQTLEASLLIVADGTGSSCRKLLGIEADQYDDGEVALAGTLELSRPHQQVAYERFTRQGTKALLPMFDSSQYRFVWTMSCDLMEKVHEFSDKKLLDTLQKAFSNYVGEFKTLTKGGVFPLKTMISKEQIRPRTVLMGNAAHTIYPIAAQGFNLGLRDVAALSDILVNGKAQKKPLGEWDALQEYEQLRKKDQKMVVGFTRHMSALFELQLPLLDQARGLGLMAMDLLPGLKGRFIERILGRVGQLPRLARGVPLWE